MTFLTLPQSERAAPKAFKAPKREPSQKNIIRRIAADQARAKKAEKK